MNEDSYMAHLSATIEQKDVIGTTLFIQSMLREIMDDQPVEMHSMLNAAFFKIADYFAIKERLTHKVRPSTFGETMGMMPEIEHRKFRNGERL